MAHHHSPLFDIRFAGFLLGAALVLLPGEGVAEASDQVTDDPYSRSVAAEFVYSLRLPGIGDYIRRPSALFVDSVHGEVLVGDAGLNRLVIFDRDGVFRYEFNFADQVGSVIDIAVDSSGFVYVLGTSREGRRVLRYDFDGVFLDEVTIDGVNSQEIETLTIDDDDRLVVSDRQGVCNVVDSAGQVVLKIDTLAGVPDTSDLGLVMGKPCAHQGLLYVPASSSGTVLVFELATGEALPSIGHRGSLPGEMTFPIAVDVLPSGVILVLDQMRFNVQCFSPSGRFLGEFGGKGYRDGWFYHPTLLAAVQDDQVIVGQIMDQRVQLLRVPDFVFEWLSREPDPGSEDVEVGMTLLPESDPRSP